MMLEPTLLTPRSQRRARLPGFREKLRRHGMGLRRSTVTTLQVNVGKICNQACHHCHVEAGPARTESMTRETAGRVLELLAANETIGTLDITGGAPELNPSFRFLVSGARALGRQVTDRCNLTVLLRPGQEDTPSFLAENQVGIIASLPCYMKENVERQRGARVFDASIEALRALNGLGYGRPGSELALDLVYNPVGAFLPPPQDRLERRYREELSSRFGIEFNRLLTITNMPIKRFAHDLARQGRHDEYMGLLVSHFNPDTVVSLMCRSTLSVGHDGSLYDCDFNQMLEIPLGGKRTSLWDLENLSDLDGDGIATASHCFGCTAGAGSSCGGTIA